MGGERHVIAIGLGLGLGISAASARAPGSPLGSPAPPAAATSLDWLPKIHQALAAKEYEASASSAGLQAPNRKHGLRTWFEPTGVRVHDRNAAGSPAEDLAVLERLVNLVLPPPPLLDSCEAYTTP